MTALAMWLKSRGKTATWLAEQVGHDRSHIVRVKNGDALPSVVLTAKIQRLTEGEITALDFVSLPEPVADAVASLGVTV